MVCDAFRLWTVCWLDMLLCCGSKPLAKAPLYTCLFLLNTCSGRPPGCRGVVAALHQMGMRCVMVTGDNWRTARAIGDQAGSQPLCLPAHLPA